MQGHGQLKTKGKYKYTKEIRTHTQGDKKISQKRTDVKSLGISSQTPDVVRHNSASTGGYDLYIARNRKTNTEEL